MNGRKNVFKILLICMMVMTLCLGTGRYGTALQPAEENASSDVLSHVTPLKLMPVGAAVGIHIQTNGLMVLGTSEITTISGSKEHPAKDLVRSGDYILKVNDEAVATTSRMTEIVNASAGQTIRLTILRDGQTMDISIKTAQTGDHEYKAGIWIRDDTQGIGTLSYIDEKNRFAALGHGIADIDTGCRIDISGGGLYPASIYAIIKGENEKPGEMAGHILYGKKQKFAKITDNMPEGIYGILNDGSGYQYHAEKAMDVGLKEEMHVGAAAIRCQIDGVIGDYDVWISGIDFNDSQKNRDFVIEVKDEKLLEATGGIVQGMSGSPVIQDQKIVGVVTHVFLDNPAKGYGIFIEKMIAQSETLEE